MRTIIGSDMGPSRWQVKWQQSSMAPLPLISPVGGVTWLGLGLGLGLG